MIISSDYYSENDISGNATDTANLEEVFSVENYKCFPNGTVLWNGGNDTGLPTNLTNSSQADPHLSLGPCFTNQTCYFIDTSEWSGPLYLTIFIYGYVVPVNFIVTMVCNSLVIVVLSQKNMRTPTNMVLLAMAIMDLLTIACPCPWYFYEYSLGNYGIISSIWYLFSFELGCETLPQIFHTTSIWLTLALATQRWIFVCKPEAAKVWCTLENTKWGIAAIFCLSCLHQITR